MQDGKITTLIDKDVKQLTTMYKDRQYERNRKNVQQIYNQIEEYRRQIAELMAASDDESEA